MGVLDSAVKRNFIRTNASVFGSNTTEMHAHLKIKDSKTFPI